MFQKWNIIENLKYPNMEAIKYLELGLESDNGGNSGNFRHIS